MTTLGTLHGLSVPQFPQPGDGASAGRLKGWGPPRCTPRAVTWHLPVTTGHHDFPRDGITQPRRAAGDGVEPEWEGTVWLSGRSGGSDCGTGRGGQDHRAHPGCPLWRRFWKGQGRQGVSEVPRVGTGNGEGGWHRAGERWKQRHLVKGGDGAGPCRRSRWGGVCWSLGAGWRSLGPGRVQRSEA